MTKQVALSEEAYRRLRRAKRSGESFSDAVVRLLDASPEDKDPVLAFSRFPHRFTITMDEHLAQVEADRDADRADPWEEHAGP